MSVASGWIVYALALLLVAMFLRRMRGYSLEDMFDAGAREHHRVLKMLEEHPGGGRWRDVRAWLGESRK